MSINQIGLFNHSNLIILAMYSNKTTLPYRVSKNKVISDRCYGEQEKNGYLSSYKKHRTSIAISKNQLILLAKNSTTIGTENRVLPTICDDKTSAVNDMRAVSDDQNLLGNRTVKFTNYRLDFDGAARFGTHYIYCSLNGLILISTQYFLLIPINSQASFQHYIDHIYACMRTCWAELIMAYMGVRKVKCLASSLTRINVTLLYICRTQLYLSM